MKNYRLWGQTPYKVVVVHGGPGAPGSIAPVAHGLSKDMGVLEPLQTRNSIDGQIEELADVINKYAETPVTLVGWSWGATLSYFTAAKFSGIVKKLILIGTSPFVVKNIPREDLTPIYMERLSESGKAEFASLVSQFRNREREDKSAAFRALCLLVTKAESYEPIPAKDDVLEYQLDINRSIGTELGDLVNSNRLMDKGTGISCPVVAIQGDYDPRSAVMVQQALADKVKEFKFILLSKCGHTPWMEKYARENFFSVLREEIIL
jgi:pimeloyl-ACP methyl ester carboxylesterase